MFITKKRHERELAEAIEKCNQTRRSAIKQLEELNARDKKELSEFIERCRSWIRVRAHENHDELGRREYNYTVSAEFTAEFLHYGMGGSHAMARMITKELSEMGYMALVALCHLDQPPRLYGEGE